MFPSEQQLKQTFCNKKKIKFRRNRISRRGKLVVIFRSKSHLRIRTDGKSVASGCARRQFCFYSGRGRSQIPNTKVAGFPPNDKSTTVRQQLNRSYVIISLLKNKSLKLINNRTKITFLISHLARINRLKMDRLHYKLAVIIYFSHPTLRQ